jgi:hypothetical protein
MSMSASRSRLLFATALAVFATVSCGGGGGGGGAAPAPPPIVPVDGPAWPAFGNDPQHSANGAVATQSLASIKWSAPLDLTPQRTGTGALLIHYGSPVITRHNVVLMPVKTGAPGSTAGYRVEARIGQTGDLVWSLDSDWRQPVHRWMPAFNVTLSGNRLVMPMSGGRILVRSDPESASGTTQTIAFYGNSQYQANPAAFDNSVFVNTPVTADSQGNLFFGVGVSGINPLGLTGGVVRIAADGTATFKDAATVAGDVTLTKTALNSAPALSRDESSVYVVVNGATTSTNSTTAGQILRLDSTTLARMSGRALRDPATGDPAGVTDDATSSPTVGPDGDVYIGVLESAPPAHHFRGWLLHFDATLAASKAPASFGWDLTPSIVPASMIGNYAGPSTYLLAIKYNNYAGNAGGNGDNRVAVVDPNATQNDPITPAAQVMREVRTLPGPTADPGGGVSEWCINTAAVDPATNSVLVNSEDGFLYRWHLPSNTFSERIRMDNGIAEAYTPTLIAPDGRVYSVNNATLFSVGQ